VVFIAVLVDILAKKKPKPSPTFSIPGFDGDRGLDQGFGAPDGIFGAPHGIFGAPLVLFLVGLVVVGALAYLGYVRRQQRISACRALATRLGLTYTSGDAHGLLALPFPLLGKGDARGTENVLHGEYEGRTMSVFDYWYYVETTDAQGKRSRSTYRFNCVATTYDASGPRLSIDEENLLTLLADAVALDDIAFESEEFNRAFNVKGDDERFATAFVDARMMAWLLAHGRDHAFEVTGSHVLVTGRQVDVAAWPVLMSLASAFVAQIPRVVSSLYPRSG
jgi:hypothetical protein